MTREKKIHTGFTILRIWMCFEVIMAHFRKYSVLPNNYVLKLLNIFTVLAVPVFMLLSFFFFDIQSFVKDKDKRKKRIERLLIPQIVWTILYYVIYYCMDQKWNLFLEHGLKDFFYQLFLGHSINQTVWFHINLIWLTLLFYYIFRKHEKNAIMITIWLGVLALIFQYSNINGNLFTSYITLPKWVEVTYVSYPIGRLAEMIPYASLGILLRHYHAVEKIKTYKQFLMPVFVIILFCFPIEQSFFVVPIGYGYQGVLKILLAVIFFLQFSMMDFSFLSKKIKNIIYQLSRYTMGIYFCQRLVASILYETRLSSILHMRPNSMYDCVLIFLFSYLLVFIMNKIPISWIKKSVV